ncbi:hypothetical protein ACLQ29_01280 [Micromonospora sp. DT228]|uniref:hypothetical protein n=1 Tax=Micromonospora sp. DT228 TaxID=3393443 RepID=UPI003CF79435
MASSDPQSGKSNLWAWPVGILIGLAIGIPSFGSTGGVAFGVALGIAFAIAFGAAKGRTDDDPATGGPDGGAATWDGAEGPRRG